MTDETTDPAPVDEPAPEPWSAAIDAACDALETYTSWRYMSADIDRCAQLTGISATTAARFERTLRQLEVPTETTRPPGEDQGAATHEGMTST